MSVFLVILFDLLLCYFFENILILYTRVRVFVLSFRETGCLVTAGLRIIIQKTNTSNNKNISTKLIGHAAVIPI